MNRPNATDEKYLWGYDVMSYQKDLELYCDELEKSLHKSYQGHLLEVVIPSLESRIKTLDKTLAHYQNQLLDTEKALDKACEEWEKEVPHCDFLLIKNKICDEKCGTCNLEKRKNYRKEWCMSDE